jgi:retron-type reverse transcriptase
MLVERLAKQTGLNQSQINRYAETASKRYKTFAIAKRDGTERIISQPSREIKAIQRWLIRNIFRRIPIHSSATAYAKGASIRDNVDRHSGSNFTLRVDFEEFFPSFSSHDVERLLNTVNDSMGIGLTEQDVLFTKKIVSRYDKLTIGAPTSPILTNIMMAEFDNKLSKWSKERGLVYTRYADDIFLSSMEAGKLSEAKNVVEGYATANEFGKLKLKHEKTVFLSRRARRAITGLVITSDRKVSIGRNRKREIKTLIHLHKHGILEIEKFSYLRGMLAFVADVEPSFRVALTRKFGGELISEIDGGRFAGTNEHHP